MAALDSAGGRARSIGPVGGVLSDSADDTLPEPTGDVLAEPADRRTLASGNRTVSDSDEEVLRTGSVAVSTGDRPWRTSSVACAHDT